MSGRNRYSQVHKTLVLNIPYKLLFSLAEQIASGLNYLHTHQPVIVHGDLKGNNILLSGDMNNPTVKIADFGLSKFEVEGEVQTGTQDFDKLFTPSYAAPELFYPSRKKTTFTDIYAFGMILWEMVTNTFPYFQFTIKQAEGHIKNNWLPSVPENLPLLFESIMLDCWSKKPTERPSAINILERLASRSPSLEGLTYQKNANPKTFSKLSKIQYELGGKYFADKNFVQATKYYQLSAEQGFALAQLDLGYCYYSGCGVEKDFSKAAKNYQLAADQGNPIAQYNLGLCYQDGLGVERNLIEATQYFKLSADQGYKPAQDALANCYSNGWGVVNKNLQEETSCNQFTTSSTPFFMPPAKRRRVDTPVVQELFPAVPPKADETGTFMEWKFMPIKFNRL